ncbi:hypothetical protein TNCV_1745401 [Trichonephila clavipes]|nr:hypothetical protein TNCV_1745401 [Trichonephila clavipes]
MLNIFFDTQGIIHEEFLPERTTINAASYIGILTHFMKRLRRIRLQYGKPGSCFSVDENVHPHIASIIKQFLAKRGCCNLNIHNSSKYESSRHFPILPSQTCFGR